MQFKPKVFLSHSKKDKEFIEKLCNDLRKCQIDPWLDSIEIRHGKPWLDEIFKHGIPSFDSILVYFTINSIESNVVKKEIDTSLINQLKENYMSFFPYLNNDSIRDKLRLDIQALQCPVWNKDNYYEMLPVVVANIWSSYLEKTLHENLQIEILKRQNAELKLEKIEANSNKNIFSENENSEFLYIYKKLSRYEEFSFQIIGYKNSISDELQERNKIKIRIGLLLIALKQKYSKFLKYDIHQLVKSEVVKFLNIKTEEIKLNDVSKILLEELLMYDFLLKVFKPPAQRLIQTSKSKIEHLRYQHDTGTIIYYFNEKFERFIYWLNYNNKNFEKPIICESKT